ncbi:MAG: sigma-70 family RNA polymerase sigma factor [Bacteroidales bacterium]|nr:sigma-70 family RNA polymerase sigma factor [Bacteroidales bacterium]MBN2758482.1 sigma-70 family RNA polymerase sigma factor [Bacteroidales bacterium]
MSDKQIIELIINSKHSKALAKLYKIYPAVQKYITEYGADAAEAKDIFQDALYIFIMKINDSNFYLNSSISTYIFGICKNLFKENLRKNNKIINQNIEIPDEEHIKDVDYFLEEEQKYRALDKILIEIGEKCMELLKMFYYQNISMKAIAIKLGFKNESSAKTQKYKCIEQARNLTKTVLLRTQTKIS